MGLDYPSLQEVQADIILTKMSAFGDVGPYSERVGFDGIGQAESGAMFMSGTPSQPMKEAAPYVDFGTAILHAFGTLVAILERQKSGQGQVVSGSLLATALTILNSYLIEQELNTPNRVGSGSRSQITGPSDCFQTQDGWIICQVIGDSLFKRWAKLVGADEFIGDPRFANDRLRGDNGVLLSERMSAWCAERTTEDAIVELEAARIPAGTVNSPQQVLDDPHVQAAELLKRVDYPGLTAPAPIVDTPIRLSRTPGGIHSRAPLLGEHTDTILAELGYNDDEVSDLRAKRVV
jgi:crotonobetainyl-CoA:carnitine CoA-transferase CaiB-like acyl-CoA transferase